MDKQTILSMLMDERKKVENVKENVKVIYDLQPHTVESDRLLIYEYLLEFHNIRPDVSFRYLTRFLCKNCISLESITRAGRYWRSQEPEKYMRTMDSEELEGVYKDVFKKA